MRPFASNRHRRGNATLEFPLVIIPFLFFVLGIFEASLAVWTHQSLSHAVRQGVRYASVHGSNSPVTQDDIQSVVRGNSVGMFRDSINVTVAYSPNNEPGNVVEVHAAYAYNPIFINLLFPRFTLNSQSRSTIYN